MEIRLLRSFLTVAREQNISRAAQILHITQPSLSRQIMDLEDSLGLTLFHRGKRVMTLTEQGMLLQKRAEQILGLVHKTEEELATVESVGGTVYIGAGETHAFRSLTDGIKKLVSEHPEIRFHLMSGNAEDVMERLDKGLLDFGVLIEPANITKYDYLRLPISDRWGIFMRSDCPLAAQESIRPEDIWNEPLICSRQALEGGQFSSWLNIAQDRLNVVATYNLMFNALLLVEAGVGLVVGLDNLINTTENSKLCFRPLNPPLFSHVDLVWNKSQVLSKASKLFLEKVRAVIMD